MNQKGNNPVKTSDELDLAALFYEIAKGKWMIISLTGLTTIIGLIIAFNIPNMYQSRSILVNTESSSNISRSLQNYAGLAGLAGINLPSESDDSNFAQAIQKINTLSFFTDSIRPNIFLPDLMAFKSWDSKNNKLVYDKNIYDIDSNSWVRDYSHPNKQIPSSQESFKIFKKHFSLIENKKTGFITLKIKHQSPHIAKMWSDLLINEINKFYRQKDKSASIRAVEYLNEQILITNLSEVKEIISELLKEETQKLALIEANKFYVFDFIDPPAVMERESEPNRVFIIILSFFMGGMLGVITVLLKYYLSRSQSIDK